MKYFGSVFIVTSWTASPTSCTVTAISGRRDLKSDKNLVDYFCAKPRNNHNNDRASSFVPKLTFHMVLFT